MSSSTAKPSEDARLASCASNLFDALSQTFGDEAVKHKFGRDSSALLTSLQGIMGTQSASHLPKAFGLMHLATQLQKRAAYGDITIPRTQAALTELCTDAARGVEKTNGESIRPDVDGALSSAENTLRAMKDCSGEKPAPRTRSDFEDIDDEEGWSLSSIGTSILAGSVLLAGAAAWWYLSRKAEYDEYDQYGVYDDDVDWSE